MKFIYFGGGTPSYLSTTQLRQLTDGMKALGRSGRDRANWASSPNTSSLKKLASRDLSLGRKPPGQRPESDGRAHESKGDFQPTISHRVAGFRKSTSTRFRERWRKPKKTGSSKATRS